MDLSSIAKNIAKVLSKNSPAILTGLGIAGFGTTVVMVARAAPEAGKAHRVREMDRAAIEYDGSTGAITKEERRTELVRTYKDEALDLLPLYGPPAAVGILSVACFVGANKIQADRQAALMAAYSLSEKTLATYQQKVIEKLGEEAESDIRKETVKEVVQSEAPEGEEHLSPVVPAGLSRCFDLVTGRYFFSSRERILAAESEINKRLLDETRVPLQEFYYALGLEERFVLGDTIGWDISSPYMPQMVDVHFTPMLDDEKNPVLAITYHVAIFDRQA